MKRIGVYGGTFNPVHIAHLITAEEVSEQMHLEKVLFIPTAHHPLKNEESIIDAGTRLKMLEIAINGNDKFESSDIEITEDEQKSYTVNTLIKLREKYKDEQVKFYLIIGMDNFAELQKWKEPDKLFMLAEVIVINRPGYFADDIKNDYSRQVVYAPVTNIDISSTEIRNRVRENRSIKYLVPDGVERFIQQNKLYTS